MGWLAFLKGDGLSAEAHTGGLLHCCSPSIYNNLMEKVSFSFVSPPSNFFGPLYPTEDHERIVEIFGIKNSDSVLDIGGGDNPFIRADTVVDTELGTSPHRDGQSIRQDFKKRYVKADVQELPFGDKSFDFVFCSHVLEHVADPEQACREIIRVAKRGYIETPRKWMELFAGHPSHQWLIDVNGGVLVFEKRKFIESPYLNCALHAAWRHKRLEERGLKEFRNISCVQYCWEDSFEFAVLDKDDGGFDYSNPYHAALSHYFFARNILLMGAPPENGLYHAETAARLGPGTDHFQVLVAAYSLVLKKDELWSASSGFLYEKKILTKLDVLLPGLGLQKRTLGKLLKVIDETPGPSEVYRE